MFQSLKHLFPSFHVNTDPHWLSLPSSQHNMLLYPWYTQEVMAKGGKTGTSETHCNTTTSHAWPKTKTHALYKSSVCRTCWKNWFHDHRSHPLIGQQWEKCKWTYHNWCLPAASPATTQTLLFRRAAAQNKASEQRACSVCRIVPPAASLCVFNHHQLNMRPADVPCHLPASAAQ